LPPRATRSFSIPLICTLYGVLSGSSHRLNLRFQFLALRQILCLLTPQKTTLEKLADRRTYAVPPSADFLNATICRARCARGMFRLFWRVLIEGGRVRLPPAAGWKKKRKKSQNFDLWLPQVQKTKKKAVNQAGPGSLPLLFPARLQQHGKPLNLKKNWPGIRAKLVSEGRYFGRREAAPRTFPSAHHDTLQCTARYWNALQHAATLHSYMCLLWPAFTARYV